MSPRLRHTSVRLSPTELSAVPTENEGLKPASGIWYPTNRRGHPCQNNKQLAEQINATANAGKAIPGQKPEKPAKTRAA
jgi:hypothetical protein